MLKKVLSLTMAVAIIGGIATSCSKACTYKVGSTEYCFDTEGGYTADGKTVESATSVEYDADALELACDAISGTTASGACE